MNQDYTYDEILKTLLEDAPAEIPDTESLSELQLPEFAGQVLEMVQNRISAPLQTLGLLTGVILLSALAGSLRSEKSGISKICDVTAVLCAVGILISPLTEAFQQAAEVLTHSADFMVTFSGIFGGILAVSGHVTASAGYQGAVLLLCNLALEIAVRVLFPVLTMGLAVSLTEAVTPELSLNGILTLFQKFTVWVLGFLMALFLGFLSVQSVVSVTADRAGTKAAKYAIAGAVPFVGGAVSDAYAAVLGSLNVLKSTAGMTGVIAVLSILLPIIIEFFLWKILTGTAAAVSEVFALESLQRLFRNLEAMISVGFSVSASFGVMFCVSTGILAAVSST